MRRVVDATQSLGAVPFSFAEVDPDFLVVSKPIGGVTLDNAPQALAAVFAKSAATATPATCQSPTSS